MKALRAGLMLLVACCTLFSARARAQYSYYGPEDFNRCRAQAAATGAAAGGFAGTAMGMVTSAATGANQVLGAIAGGVAGATAGGLLGYGLSCDDEIQVSSHLFEFANDRNHRYRYYMPYEAPNVRIVQLVSGYDGAVPAHFCRLYHVEYFSFGLRQWRAFKTTMCLVNGGWVFPNAAPGVPIIVRQYQAVQNPMIRVQASPVFRPEPPRPPVGPYRFASSPVVQHGIGRELQEEPAIVPSGFAPGPADRPAAPGFYPQRLQ